MAEPMPPAAVPSPFMSLRSLRTALQGIPGRQCGRQTAAGSKGPGRSQHTQCLVHEVQRPLLRAWGTHCLLDMSMHPFLPDTWGTPSVWWPDAKAEVDKGALSPLP